MELDCSIKGDVNVDCSWHVGSGCQDLKSAIKFSTELSCSLDDLVQVETCIHLCSPDPLENIPSVPCRINIKLDKDSKFSITGVTAVSEARIIECYGICEEYITTIQSEYLDDFEGCAVYSATSNVVPTKEITLKFTRMKQSHKMWLYGLMFTIEQSGLPQLKVGGINLSNVNTMLKESSRPISEKAEHFKKLLQQCLEGSCNSTDSSSGSCSSSSNVASGSIDPQILMKMFEGEYLKPLGETSKSMSRCFMKLLPFVMNSNKTSQEQQQLHTTTDLNGVHQHDENEESKITLKQDMITFSTLSNGCSKTVHVDPDELSISKMSHNYCKNNYNNNISLNYDDNTSDDCIKIMKEYVDKRLNEMEETLINKLEKRISDIEINQSQKLDAILKLLESK